MAETYVLDREMRLRKEPNKVLWYAWFARFSRNGRPVAGPDIHAGTEIRTHFLGVDQNFTGEGKPRLFVTNIRRPAGKIDQFYTSDYTSALDFHERQVRKIKDG